MNRRAFLKAIGSAALLPILPHRLSASTDFRRRRPSDAKWPSQSAWKRLDEAVGGNLIPVDFPLSLLKTDRAGAEAKLLSENLKNPYYIGDQPGSRRRSRTWRCFRFRFGFGDQVERWRRWRLLRGACSQRER
jgi:hypothetical protein